MSSLMRWEEGEIFPVVGLQRSAAWYQENNVHSGFSMRIKSMCLFTIVLFVYQEHAGLINTTTGVDAGPSLSDQWSQVFVQLQELECSVVILDYTILTYFGIWDDHVAFHIRKMRPCPSIWSKLLPEGRLYGIPKQLLRRVLGTDW